jgi:two-component system sensor histidine kinase TctE
MLVNLTDNAIRYTPAGGSVTLGVRADGGHWLLWVEDSGPGIPVSERERVFERFYRILGHNEPGCGLGLAIVAECARGLDASLRLSEGAHGRGLRVEVRLAMAG